MKFKPKYVFSNDFEFTIINNGIMNTNNNSYIYSKKYYYEGYIKKNHNIASEINLDEYYDVDEYNINDMCFYIVFDDNKSFVVYPELEGIVEDLKTYYNICTLDEYIIKEIIE